MASRQIILRVRGRDCITRCDRHEDCRAWGLTVFQCAHYHVRLARYFARRSRMYADQADRLAARARAFGKAAIACWILTALLLIAQVIW